MTVQGTGALIKTRMYMEGRLVENGLVSTTVSGGVGGPATASLELVPTNTIKHIMPGTWVHIFTTDPWDLNPAGDLSDFKLLFEGVVITRGFTRQGSGRNFVVQCAGPEIYWTEARQFWMNISSMNGGLVDQLAVQTSGGYGRFGTVSATGAYGYMSSKLAFADKDQPEERFMDTLISVLDDIGNVNPFYTNARNRFRLTDRILRAPAGKTDKLFQVSLLGDFLDGLAGRVSGQTNISDVVNQVLSAIMHEWVSIPAPPYVKARIFDRDPFGNIKRNKKKVTKRGPRGRETVDLFEYETAEEKIVGSIMFKPHVYTIAPPSCNVLFPNMYETMNFQENFLQEPTRLSMQPQMPQFLGGSALTQGLLLQRPVELEIFGALARDPKRRTPKKRDADANFADGAGQAPNYTDYDWTTNEERIRGIVYNFVNLAPAPSTLTLSDPGKRQPSGTRKGGTPKYLQNAASYEFFKSKFIARQTALSGPYNMRPVPGFPLVALDDSEAKMNVICNLRNIQHHIDAGGQATTQYSIEYPRLAEEVDYNQPIFKGGTKDNGELDFDLLRDSEGQYDFTTIFEGLNQPPIPEWFDETFTNVLDLDIKYKEWFGKEAGVIQRVMFGNPTEGIAQAIINEAAKALQVEGLADKAFATVGAVAKAFGDQKDKFEEILKENENISVEDAITMLNFKFSKARNSGKEFEEAAAFTDRSFTRIDEAFRFVGAAPLELADPVPTEATTETKNKGPQFTKHPAATRVIDYKNMRLDFFVGDTSTGSGYIGVPEGSAPTAPTATTSEVDPSSLARMSLAVAAAAKIGNRMSGAFPIFDTKIHDGTAATDKKVRDALLAGGERQPSNRARYDGRPLMFDFEFRLWQDSLKAAGFGPDESKISQNSDAAEYVVENGVVRRKTAHEIMTAGLNRSINLEAAKKEEEALKKRGRSNPKKKSKNMKPSVQAPTGDGLEMEQKIPLPQPLSEKQVIDLRRAIIDAYRDELTRTRGFTG